MDSGMAIDTVEVLNEVKASEETGPVRGEWLLSTGIGSGDSFAIVEIVKFVDTIEKENSWLSPVPGTPHNLVPEVSGVDRPVFLSTPGEIEAGSFFDSFHESVCNAYRDVEVSEVIDILFGADEFLNIGMVNPQYAHLSSSTVTS
jgi:hypothetical protein